MFKSKLQRLFHRRKNLRYPIMWHEMAGYMMFLNMKWVETYEEGERFYKKLIKRPGFVKMI